MQDLAYVHHMSVMYEMPIGSIGIYIINCVIFIDASQSAVQKACLEAIDLTFAELRLGRR